MALTKAEMAERLYEDVGLNKREAKEFVDAFFDVLREALQQGRQVKLSGFGNFDLRRKNQRPGRNPKTGEEIPITARTVVTFRSGEAVETTSNPDCPERDLVKQGARLRSKFNLLVTPVLGVAGTGSSSVERPAASSWRITRSGRNSSRCMRRIVRRREMSEDE